MRGTEWQSIRGTYVKNEIYQHGSQSQILSLKSTWTVLPREANFCEAASVASSLEKHTDATAGAFQ
jgi:hypothetical protein